MQEMSPNGTPPITGAQYAAADKLVHDDDDKRVFAAFRRQGSRKSGGEEAPVVSRPKPSLYTAMADVAAQAR
ncbi:MAG: hypothetical protein A3J48_04450 [Candidatus Doudnabacteria bacterium RIFCSPHIGHO2_02_FULL_46_11]|uniref:Uncharacterized protein n=1 Tax=Candidatus Doudnabacteria bacterium RIFCSPHIGHO2_02_FULL_46_11 TaxID=1817832 RepID=A0A1F5P7R5_9BACT|nr:MAG: hypothetical protein A3J48_04450 [Candidatus Doudnabacteria bacterium RIFCSPHIGHO2_02_FULL_46_11]